jgi:enoyl-CoA hydratase
MHTIDEVLFSVEQHVGVITLNRARALNALNFSMFKALLQQLEAWKHDMNIHAVIIQAISGRAFCAGGDVRWVYDVGQDAPLEALDLFRHEYQLNYLISDFGKPYIALMDGLTIGGGVGVTLHGSHTVASEHFSFLMPEASIGFFPDIGSSHLLSACPGGYGLYLGLTGRRANAADSKVLGFVGYTIPSDDFLNLKHDLTAMDLSSDASSKVSACLKSYQVNMPSGELPTEADAVSRCFEGKRLLRDIFEALEGDESAWARATQATLLEQSPLSLHVTFEQLQRAQGLSLAACLEMDYGLAYHFLHDHDFYEGVRARLVDKDKSPHWSPASWEAVYPDNIALYFEEPLDVSSLW